MRSSKKSIAALLSLALTLSVAAIPAAAAGGCPNKVNYALGAGGVSADLTAEAVEDGKTPDSVPAVTALGALKFLGWSLTDPAKLKEGEKAELVDPTTVKIRDDTTFYAVYGADHALIDHVHYVIGYPDGRFAPEDDITRGSVATIIARSCLEGFVEGGSYGNPGGYTDVESNWAYSAISYCTLKGVFKGYGDGTFRPDQPITRQELATVVARIRGEQPNTGMPFSDADEIAEWAKDGIYTAYVNGWVDGYTDGTFKPWNNIRRDETVKIFNRYLGRGVDAKGLEGLTEFVSGSGDGQGQYKTWPDVPQDQWAYYEIVEASNDHTFYWPDADDPTPPEVWETATVDPRWLGE